jgi:hypothetical protein
MLAVTPRDIVTRMRPLLLIIGALFTVMLLGAALGAWLDVGARRRILARLCALDAGFRIAPASAADNDGATLASSTRAAAASGAVSGEEVWVWRFTLAPLTRELAPPCGSGVVLAGILGLPCSRLRACLPDELLAPHAGMAAALGRRHALSPSGMDGALEQQRQLLRQDAGSSRCRGGSASIAPRAASALAEGGAAGPKTGPPLSRRKHLAALVEDASAEDAAAEAAAATAQAEAAAATAEAAIAEAEAAAAAADAAAAAADAAREEFVGTALVLAFMQVASLLSAEQLSARCAAAARHFCAITTPSGMSFDALRCACLTLLSPGVLNAPRGWMVRAPVAPRAQPALLRRVGCVRQRGVRAGGARRGRDARAARQPLAPAAPALSRARHRRGSARRRRRRHRRC